MNGLSILLGAKLAKTKDTINDINKQIQNLSNNKSLEKIKLKIDIDEKELLNISNRIKDIQTQLSKGFNTSGASSASTPKILPQLDPNDIENRVKRITNSLDRLKVGKDKVFADTRVSSEVFKLDDMISQFRRGEISSKDLSLQMDTLRTKVAQVSGEFKNVNKDGYSFSDMMTLAAKKIIIWKVAGDAVFTVIRMLKQIPKIVSEIDKSLTEINKVLDLSTSQMKELALEATNLGIAYGRTTVEILNSIGAFAKAGLDKETSQQFAELAALLSNVGDISTEVAQKTLIMANAGYQLGNNYETLNALISQFNELANRNAVEVETLAEAWQMSASMAKQANLSIEDYNALITVAGSVSQRSGKEVGNALRTWFMRLQGVSDGADTLEEDISKVDKVLGDLGIQLRESPTKFRPAMQVITEIAAKYRELGEAGETVKQSELLEALAGKYRANIVAGVLQNFDQINKAIDDQANSFQSAEKENARYMNSIQAKTKQLAAQWELFASHTLDSGLVKSIVDLGRVLIQVLDSGFVRFIATVALVTTAAWGLSTAFTALKATTLGTAIGVLALDVAEKGLLITTKALWVTLSASPLFWVAAATAAIYGIVKVFDALNVTIEEQQEKVEKAQQSYKEITTEIESLNEELETTIKRIDELNSKDKLSIVEEDELSKLQLSNKELELRLAMLEKEEEIKAKRLGEEQLELYNKQYGKHDFSESKITEYQQNAQLTGNNAILLAEMNDIAALSAAYQQFSELKKEALESGNLDDVEHFDSILTDIQESLINSSKELQIAKDVLSSLKNPTEEQEQALKGIEVRLDAINRIVIPDKIISMAEESKKSLYEQAKSAEALAKIYDEANDSIKDLSSSGKELSSIFEDIAEGEKLSTDQLLTLISKYPEMAAQILSINNSKEQGISITNLLWEVEKQRSIAKIKADRDELISEQTKLEGYRKAYQALSSIMGIVPKEIQEGLSQYNNITNQINGLTAAIDTLQNSKLSDYTSKSTSSKSKYTPSTEQSALKELLDADRITLQEYYDRLLILEKSQYSNYANKSAEQLEKLLRSQNKDVAKKTEEYLALNIERKNIKLNLDTIALDAVVVPLTNELDDLKFAFKNLTDEEFDEKLNNIAQQLSIQKDLASIYQTAISDLTNEYKNGNITQDQYDDKLKELQSSLKNANRATIELSNSTNGLTESQKSHAEKLASEIIKTQKEIDKATLDSFKTTSDAKIKSYQDKIDALEEQNDLIEEQKQKQEKILAIQEAQNKLFEIQNDRNTKILRQKEDGTYYWSMEANPKAVKDAQDNLKKVQEDYTTWQRNVNLKKQKKHWQDLIDQEKAAQKVREDEFNKHYKNMDLLTVAYFDNLKIIYGNKWDEIIEVQKAKLKELENMQNINIDTSIPDNLVSSQKASLQSELADKQAEKAQILKDIKGKTDAENMPKIIRNAQLTRDIEELQKKISKFDTGGFTGAWGDTGKLGILHEKEIVLNKVDTANLLKAVDITRGLFSSLKTSVNIPNIPAIAGNNNGLSNGTVYNIHVDKVVANDGKQFINTLTRMVHIQ